jgi:hypothetical protein
VCAECRVFNVEARGTYGNQYALKFKGKREMGVAEEQ